MLVHIQQLITEIILNRYNEVWVQITKNTSENDSKEDVFIGAAIIFWQRLFSMVVEAREVT